MSRWRANSIYSDYAVAEAYLERARDGYSRPIANNTRIHYGASWSGSTERDTIGIKLHQTDVITLYPNGDTMFNTGGWHTVTTKDRMNYPRDFGIYSWYRPYGSEIGWVITHYPTERKWVFQDGITISKRGVCRTDAETLDHALARCEREGKQRKKMTHRSQSVAAKAIRRLRQGLPIPNCEGCQSIATNSDRYLETARHVKRGTVSAEMIQTAVADYLGYHQRDRADWRHWLNLHMAPNDDLRIGPVAPAAEPYIKRAVYAHLKHITT